MFAAPSYAFIFSFLALIIYGLVRYSLNPGIVPLIAISRQRLPKATIRSRSICFFCWEHSPTVARP